LVWKSERYSNMLFTKSEHENFQWLHSQYPRRRKLVFTQCLICIRLCIFKYPSYKDSVHIPPKVHKFWIFNSLMLPDQIHQSSILFDLIWSNGAQPRQLHVGGSEASNTLFLLSMPWHTAFSFSLFHFPDYGTSTIAQTNGEKGEDKAPYTQKQHLGSGPFVQNAGYMDRSINMRNPNGWEIPVGGHFWTSSAISNKSPCIVGYNCGRPISGVSSTSRAQ
jgi:hypothetical protein